MRLPPDILLIKPGSQKQIYGNLSEFNYTAIEPPLWGAIIAGYLREQNYRVELLDAEAEVLDYMETAQHVEKVKPLVAIVMVSGSNPSASTMNMTGAESIVSMIKQISPEIKTGVAGLHPSALPEITMQEENIDYLIQGEGFFTFPAMIDSLKSGTIPKNVPGLWYRDHGVVIKSTIPKLLNDLDLIPRPAWDMLPMDKYRAHNWHCFDNIQDRQPYAVLYTSLGCPFRCSFCCINSLFGKNTIRYRSADAVIKEVDFLVETYGVKNFKLIDEMFAMNEKRVASICDPLIERGYDLNIWAYARVNTVTPAMLKKMKKAGINWLAYGFESGNKRVMEDVTKGYKTDQVMDVVKMTQDAGIYICSNFIFGLPEDDYDSMNETLSLMVEINAEWANIYSAMAYPGSQLYDLAVQEDWTLPKDWQAYSQYSPDSQPLNTRFLTGNQVLAFRDYAFDVYYKNPRYLEMIKNTFGQGTMDYIQEMSSKKLERNFSK